MTASLLAQTHSYDAAGRLLWSTQPSGSATAFAYDPAGNVLSVTAVSPGQDTDGDGVPDSFEIEWTGSATGLDAMADLNGNGRVNLLEYALAQSPFDHSPEQPIELSFEVDSEGDRFLLFHFIRPKQGTATLIYQVQASQTLAAESWTTAGVEIIDVIDGGGGIEEVIARANLESGDTDRLFLRLRVVKLN